MLLLLLLLLLLLPDSTVHRRYSRWRHGKVEGAEHSVDHAEVDAVQPALRFCHNQVNVSLIDSAQDDGQLLAQRRIESAGNADRLHAECEHDEQGEAADECE